MLNTSFCIASYFNKIQTGSVSLWTPNTQRYRNVIFSEYLGTSWKLQDVQSRTVTAE